MIKRDFFKKKGVTLMLAGAMALGVVSLALPGTVAKAEAKPTDMKISISYENEVATIDDAGDVLYFGLGKADRNGVVTPPKAYEAVQDTDCIDISWINNTKEQYLFVCSNPDTTVETATYATIVAKDTKLKVKMVSTVEAKDKDKVVGDADNGYLTFTSGDIVSASAIQWRKENATAWDETANLDISTFVIKGASLQFRVAPDDGDDGKGGIAAGKIVKGKISAKAAAPKVTVNYLTQTVTMKQGQEYRTSQTGLWIEVKTKDDATKAFAALGFKGDENLNLYVRTKATASKLSSKTSISIINKVDSSFVGLTVATASDSAIKTATGVSVIYKTPYDTTSGLVFENGTDKNYQFALVEKTKVAEYIDGSVIKAASASAVTTMAKTVVAWKDVKAAAANGKAGTATVATKGLDVENYIILYRVVDSKNPISSAIKVADLPGKFAQTMTFKVGAAEVSTGAAVTIASGTGVTAAAEVDVLVDQISTATTKVDQKLVGVYSDIKCENKSTNIKAILSTSVSATANGKIKITGTKNTKTGETYYVKMTVQGVTSVFAVTIQ